MIEQITLFELGAAHTSAAPLPSLAVFRMIELAAIRDPKIKILAPGDCAGAICDAVRDLFARRWPDIRPSILAIEQAGEVLRIKGHAVRQADFLGVRPALTGCADLLLIAPPLEGGADIEHIRHGYGFLRAGGRMVSLINAASTVRNSISTISFGEWMADHSAELYDLPRNLFRPARGSLAVSLDVRIVVIEKPQRRQPEKQS